MICFGHTRKEMFSSFRRGWTEKKNYGRNRKTRSSPHKSKSNEQMIEERTCKASRRKDAGDSKE